MISRTRRSQMEHRPLPDGGELTWQTLARAAAQHYAAGRMIEACAAWQRAGCIVSGLPIGDPMMAADLNNLAMVDAIQGRLETAERGFRQAGAAWQAVEAWLRTMPLRRAARSSLFHHRLETRHRESFEAYRRMRLGLLIEGAAAVADFNSGVVQVLSGRCEAGRECMIEAARRSSAAAGPSSLQHRDMVRALERIAGRHVPAPSAAERSNRPYEAGPALHDPIGYLMSAVRLTAVLDRCAGLEPASGHCPPSVGSAGIEFPGPDFTI